jgi:acrosin
LTATSINDWGMTGNVNYATAESLTINLGSGGDTFTVNDTHAGSTFINGGGGGADVINVRAISGATTINAGAGSDTLRVGSLAPTAGGDLMGIRATLTLEGGADNDSITIDNTGSVAAATGSLTETSINGLGITGNLNYDTTESLTINLGSGGDTFTVNDTHAGSTVINGGVGADMINVRAISGMTTIDAGAGSDSLWVGSLVPTAGGDLTRIRATLTLEGGADNDSITIDNTGSVAAVTGSLTDTSINGLGITGNLNYATTESLTIDLGGGADTFTVNDTHAGSTFINSGSGADVINFRAISGATTINAGAGSDTVYIALTPDQFGYLTTAQIIDLNAYLATPTRSQNLDLAIRDNTNAVVLDINTIDFEVARIAIYDGGLILDVTTCFTPIMSKSQIITGTTGDDASLAGTQAADLIFGQAGNDTIYGDLGSDCVFGGDGDDRIYGEMGNDKLFGHAGADLLDGGDGDDTVDGGAGLDDLRGGAGNDLFPARNDEAATDSLNGGAGIDRLLNVGDGDLTLSVFRGLTSNIESVAGGERKIIGTRGSDSLDFRLIASGTAFVSLVEVTSIEVGLGNDIVHGTDGADTILGGAGDDSIYGYAGNDLLRGECGVDMLDGGLGNDTLEGGDGDDSLYGKTGNDKLFGHAGATCGAERATICSRRETTRRRPIRSTAERGSTGC